MLMLSQLTRVTFVIGQYNSKSRLWRQHDLDATLATPMYCASTHETRYAVFGPTTDFLEKKKNYLSKNIIRVYKLFKL